MKVNVKILLLYKVVNGIRNTIFIFNSIDNKTDTRKYNRKSLEIRLSTRTKKTSLIVEFNKKLIVNSIKNELKI